MTNNERAAMEAANPFKPQLVGDVHHGGAWEMGWVAALAYRDAHPVQQKAGEPIDPNLACDLCHPNGKRSLGNCAYCRVLSGLRQVKHD